MSSIRRWYPLLSLLAALVLLFPLSAACSPSAPPVPNPDLAKPARSETAGGQPATAPAASAPATAPAAPAALAATPTSFGEAPALAQQVRDGKLPPVEQRLPENPLVVQPIEEIGQYGGTWRLAFTGVADFHAYGRNVYEPILRWPRDPKDPIG